MAITWFYRVLLGFTGSYWVLLAFTGFYWALLDLIGCNCDLLGFPSFFSWHYWVLLGFTGFNWALPVLTGFNWIWLVIYWFLMGSAAFSCIWLRFLLVYFLGITGFYLVLLSFTKFNLVVLRFSLVTDFYGLLPSFTRFSWMSTVFFARVDCVVPFCGIFWNWIGFYGFF